MNKSEISYDNVLNTLDEPIKDTIYRDLNGIWKNMKYVLLPRAYQEKCAQLRDWDLWGPLFLCLFLNIILWIKSDSQEKRLLFSLLFVFMGAGAIIVTLNGLLLDAKISIFQGLCVLGYCLLPIDLAALITIFIPAALIFFKLCTFALAIIWSIRAASSFMASIVQPERKGLVLYPVYLFYVSISWIVLVSE